MSNKKVLCVIGICLESEIPLLNLNLSQIERYKYDYKHNLDIVIMNQTGLHFDTPEWVKVEDCEKVDAGYFLDVALSLEGVEEYDYFVSLDVDTFPYKRDWIDKYVDMMENDDTIIQIGVDTDLSHAYPHFGGFTHLNNYFRFMKMDMAIYLSKEVGFRRPINGLFADNGVLVSVALNKKHFFMKEKYNMGIPSAIGCTPGYGLYGFSLGDSVFHFSFGSTCEVDFPDKEKQLEILGQDYLDVMDKVRNWSGSKNDLANWLVSQLKPNIWRPQFNKSGVISC